MSFSKFMVIPVFIAIQACVLMLIAPYARTLGEGAESLATWITFQAWAMYFLAGCSIKMALKVLAGYLGGIVASIAIFTLGDALDSSAGLGQYWGYAVAVLIVVVPVIAMERVPAFNFIPAWFIGAGVFFAFMTLKGLEHNVTVYTNIAVPELAACVVGLVFGWVTVTFRGWYEKKVAVAA
jgi:hypothetical protein